MGHTYRKLSSFLIAIVTGTIAVGVVAQEPEADYAVHEWGLVRFMAQPEIATSGFGSSTPDPYYFDDYYDDYGTEAGKPVIYFHPGPGYIPGTSIDVTITLVDETVREVWPTPEGGVQPVHGESFTWSSVVIETDQPCDGELAPAEGDPACISLFDGVCEAAELPDYIGNVDHCLAVGDPPIRTPVLLYNAMLPTHTRPVVIDVVARTITNASEDTVGPVWASFDGLIYVFESLEAGATQSFDSLEAAFPLSGSQTQVSRQILERLMERGLTLIEAGQFVLAWSPNVLSEPFPWTVLGLYGQETIEHHFPLTLTPAPTETVRVLAFTLE